MIQTGRTGHGSEMTDLALAQERLAAGRRDAIETSLSPLTLRDLVTRYLGFVSRSLRHLGVPDGDVDDAAQKVFLVAAKKLESIEEGRERSFLFGTLVRIASRARRSQRRRREVADIGYEKSHEAPGPDELLDQARAREMLDSILEAMDQDLRSVFILFEIEQMTKGEISDALAIPEGTVASRLRRAREQFHKSARIFEARANIRGGRHG